MITASRLQACGVKPLQASIFAPRLVAACAEFLIDTPAKQAGFLAQALHESAMLAKMAENCYYSKPEFIWNAFKRLHPLGMVKLATYCRSPERLANLAYAHINGNGDEASGDGWRYRGSGIFGLTGKNNFHAAGVALGVDLVADPDLVRSQPEFAVLTGALFWKTHGCSELMEEADFDGTTLRIQGVQRIQAANGVPERRKLFALCSSIVTN